MYGKVYLEVPYAEKEHAKRLGARWDPALKKWYYEGPVSNYVQFARWIAGNREETILAHEFLYLVEGKTACCRCGRPTRVIGLGIGEHTRLYRNDGGGFIEETVEDEEGYEPLFLSWVDEETQIPPALLRYLKRHYPVRMDVSKTAGRCFANHCEHCGALQGNWGLFFEEDSPLTALMPDGPALRAKLAKLKIYSIGIEDSLVLDWSFGMGDQDEHYLRYCPVEPLLLPPSTDEYHSYADLYDL